MINKHSNYFIKEGYRHNLNASPYGDSESDSKIYQLDVYNYARNHILNNNVTSVLDIGCGHGMKLKEYILPNCNDVTGIDWKHSINFCKKNHDFGEWYIDNIEAPSLELNKKFDLIICADVIEHLFNPDLLFEYISKFIHEETTLILSTPERDLRRGLDTMGPPQNPAHVREWNKDEFALYLMSQKVRINEHIIVDLKKGMKTCQLINCKL